jgi:hypothetical protein
VERDRFESRWSDFLKSDDNNDYLFILQKDSLIYRTEQLVPKKKDKRPPLLLIFGNPASHSVKAGMFAFTEQGVAMLSSVLNSERAIEVNIAIMRVFVRLRDMMASHKELAAKLRELEGRIQDHDEQILAIFDAIRQLMAPPASPRKRIGFEVKEHKAVYGKKWE